MDILTVTITQDKRQEGPCLGTLGSHLEGSHLAEGRDVVTCPVDRLQANGVYPNLRRVRCLSPVRISALCEGTLTRMALEFKARDCFLSSCSLEDQKP